MITLDEYNNRHSNRMAFVLASGPSLTKIDLNVLSDYVTFAVNSSILAVPNADYFLSDDWDVSRWDYFQKDLLQSETTVLLYEDKLGKWANLFGERSVLFRHRTGYHITDQYEHNNYNNYICQARSSVGSAIHVAHIMGCRPIVLLGLDCCRHNSLRWFWQDISFDRKPQRVDGRIIDKYKQTLSHGRQTDTDLLDILRYWKVHGKEFLKKNLVYNISEGTMVNAFPKKTLNQVMERFSGRKKYL